MIVPGYSSDLFILLSMRRGQLFQQGASAIDELATKTRANAHGARRENARDGKSYYNVGAVVRNLPFIF